jgi:hypothetical protein
MKKMKKLTRENLKNVKGAGGPTYPDDSIYYCHCGGTDGILQRKSHVWILTGIIIRPFASNSN